MMQKPSWLRPLTLFAVLILAGFAIPACGAEKGTTDTAGGPTDADGSGSKVVAKIGSETITEADLKEGASADLKRIETQIYQTKRKVLKALIEQKLLDNAAKEAGTTVDALIASEVDSKLAAVTDEDARKFYDENKSRLQGEYDDVKPQIEQYMAQKARRDKLADYQKALRKSTQVVVYLEVPKVRVELGNAPVKGNADAPVTIVEFSDYQCPYCKRSQSTLEQVQKKYEGKIRVAFKDFPLSFHDRAMPAAQASRCAGEQGKFWEFHDKLFSSKDLSDEAFKRYANELSLDSEALTACVASNKYAGAVNTDMKQGQSVGVSGTPAFFINGRFLSGAQPLEAFSEVIDDELSKAGAS